MRRLTAALAALATALGLALVVAGPADASISSPSNGSVIQGNFTITDSGAGDGTACISGTAPYTTIRLYNAANQQVFTQTKSGTGSFSVTLDSHNYPNGAYQVRTEVRNRTGFLFCGGNTQNYTSNITIANAVELVFSGATSAPQNTSIPVSATLTDASNGNGVSGLTVSFALTGGGSVTATTNGSGVASASLPVAGPPRSATLTVSFAGTAYFGAESTTRSFSVTKNDTSTTVVQPATVVHGEPISFTATVAALNGSGTPSGTVQFKVDGSNFGSPVALSGGTATTPTTTSLSTGSHTVGAVYSGDGNFLASTAGNKTATVNKADTTTALSSSVNPTKYGQSVTFTAEVDVVAPGAGTPVGGVQFNIDGNPFGTAVPLSGNTAELTLSNLTAGNHDVIAVYNGNADFATSTSAPLVQGVDMAETETTLTTSDPNPVSGQPLTYTAQVAPVAPGAGTPTGQVQFTVDGDPLGGPVNLAGGQATSPATNLLVGSHSVVATYLGDSNYSGSMDTYTQSVAAAQTATTLTSSPNPSVFGQTVTLRAEVSPVTPATGTPSGAIRFTVDGSTLDIIDLTGDHAELDVSTLAVGSHDIKATFLSDDANFLPSTSPTGSQVVNKAATSTSVSSDAPTSVYGQPVTFTAEVSVTAPGAGSPSGTITFADGGDILDTVPVNSGTGFQASITTTGLAVGQHAITATYSGDGSFLGSTSSTTQVVQKASTSTVVVSSNNPALTGQPTTFTATVSPVAPGAGEPTGTVLFTLNGLPLGGPRPLTGGVATSPSFASLTPGNFKVKAQYNGDGNFLKSAGLLDQGSGQFGEKGNTSMTLDASPATAVYNAPVTLSTTVSAVAPANGKPSGVVRFWEGGTLLGSASLEPAGANAATTSLVTTSLSPGAHSIRAEYVGNYNFNGTEALTSVTVEQAPTVTGIESSANPSTFGDEVTLTAVVSEAIPAPGAPTGSVTFTEGAAVLGTATISTVGGRQVASITVPDFSGGSHDIVAAYSGDTGFSASTSATFTQVVERQEVTLKAGSPLTGPEYIDTHTGYVRAQLTDADGDPLAGQLITFRNEPFKTRPAYVLCTAVTNAQGIAECDHTAINIDPSLSGDDLLIDVNGRYTANYAGTTDYLPAVAQGQTF